MARMTNIVVNKIPLTAKEAKQEIMKMRGYTETKQYEREYDRLRNKVRAYERLSGVAAEDKQSVLEFFYKLAKSQTNPMYKPSSNMRNILAMPTVSSGKALDRYAERISQREAVNDEYIIKDKAAQVVMDNLMYDYSQLYDYDPLVREMFENIKDPYKLKKALGEYADKLHDKQKDLIEKNKGFRPGEHFGYESVANFDYSSYLA